MSEISIRNVTKRFGSDDAAVDDVSLEIADGEFMILVGPSGSGKSTLLQMIVGLLDITEGDVYIGGELDERQGAARPRPGDGLPGLCPLPASDRVREHGVPAAAAARIRTTRSRAASSEMAEMLELGEFLDRKPANLSGGQRQRVAMGRAMVRDAHAFLFDEPLSNLDAKLRAQMRTEISRLQKQFGSTTVYVTHDQVEAMTLGDRLALLRQGALQQVGTPRELYEQPVNLFVAGFIGAPPMNFLPAEVQADVLRTPFGEVPFDTGRLTGRLGDADVLIAGIRPEQFRDPALLDDDQRRRSVIHRARVDVIEWLGDEQLLYLPYEAPEPIQRQLADLGRELDAEWSRTQVVAKLSSETKVAEGEEVELAFDPADLHLFDPSTGNNLAYEPEPAAQ